MIRSYARRAKMHPFELSTACKEEELDQDYKDCELLDTFHVGFQFERLMRFLELFLFKRTPFSFLALRIGGSLIT